MRADHERVRGCGGRWRGSDGNGRTGRAIIHLVLRRRGLTPHVLPPVSLVLATLARDYVNGLTASRYVGSPSSPRQERLGRVRANSATDLLLHRLPGAPVLTAESAATLIGRTFKPANDAIQRLVGADILQQITIGRRNRAYEAPEIIEAFTDLERP